MIDLGIHIQDGWGKFGELWTFKLVDFPQRSKQKVREIWTCTRTNTPTSPLVVLKAVVASSRIHPMPLQGRLFLATVKGKWEDKTNFNSSVLTHRASHQGWVLSLFRINTK